MTADRLHQVPALIPLGELSALVTESLKSGSLPLRGSRRSGVMRQCLGTDPRCLYSYRTSALRSLRLRVLASHLGRPGTPRLVGLRSKASLGPNHPQPHGQARARRPPFSFAHTEKAMAGTTLSTFRPLR